MTSTAELLRQGRKNELWTKFCGYLDLSLDEFMRIQERLLLEQIDLLSKSEIGKKLLGEKPPVSAAEFRRTVPLTTYADYQLFLKDKRTDVLPTEPYVWARTSGHSGVDSIKWAPYNKKMYDQLGEASVGSIIMSSCTQRGEVHLEPEAVMLLGTAPPPYVSGHLSRSVKEQSNAIFVPSLEEGEAMDFSSRIAVGFDIAMRTGLDYFYGLASILAKIGERFEGDTGSSKFSSKMLHPSVFFRLVRGLITARLQKRNMLPRDIWKLTGILTGGTDTDIYRERIKHYWGKEPLEGYACTEAGILASQAWNCKGMTFNPDSNFLEFIPYEEHLKNKQDPTFQPGTVLFNELQLGVYELVFTNLMGGVFTRYRVGDLIQVIALRDEELNINLPQVRFYSRADDIIDLAGLARLTERMVWQVIEASKVAYSDWIARKEEFQGNPVLHLYLELDGQGSSTEEDSKTSIRAGFKQTRSEFIDLEYILGSDHLQVTHLAKGSFTRYMEARRKEGADLAHVKPPHMQPSDDMMKALLQGG